MLFTISIVKNALKTLIISLEEGSYFNICSFGSKRLDEYKFFMFE
jgi:hypothetical protein